MTVTLFLNQSSQNFELSLEMIISTSVQNCSRMQCFILTWQYILWRVLLTTRVLKISVDVIVTSFLNQSQQNFVLLFVIPRGISVQNLSKIGLEKKKLQKMGNEVIVTSFLKIAQQIFCVWVFFTHTYWCTKFQVHWRSDKGITGGGSKHSPCWEWPKKPGQDRVNKCVYMLSKAEPVWQGGLQDVPG